MNNTVSIPNASLAPKSLGKKAALALVALSAPLFASIPLAHADGDYQPYYVDRNTIQYSNAPTQIPTNSVAPAATGQSIAEENVSPFYHFNNEVWAAAGTELLNYKETVSPIPDSEHGWLPSIAAGGSYMTHGNLYLGLDGSVAFGNTHYNGAVYDSTTNIYDIPYQTADHQTVSTVDAKVGQGLPLGQNVMLIPYIDGGFRYWNRDSSQEDYHNFDILGGMMIQIAPIDRLMLTAYGSGGTTIGGRMIASDGFSYDLGSSAMEKVGGKIGYDLTRQFELFTTVDYDHFHYGTSPVQFSGDLESYEPGSHTEDTTMRVGIGYHFR